MFENVIYFIVVILIFTMNHTDKVAEISLPFSFFISFALWAVFSLYSWWRFKGLRKRLLLGPINQGLLTMQYRRLITRLSILAIFLFALHVYLLNLKYWLEKIAGFDRFTVLPGIVALSLFLVYLGTIWYYAYPSYKATVGTLITRRSFVLSNLKITVPILFPWVVLSFVYDVILLTSWAGPGSLLSSGPGQVVFFGGFLSILMIFMPLFIRFFWGCAPLKASDKARSLEAFLDSSGFKYSRLLRLPIFQERMMTAGIMGLVPRYRYILITDSLMDALSVEELKAVLAHEMGHGKYRHMLFYILFFIGYMALSPGLFDIFFYLLASHPFFMEAGSGNETGIANIFHLSLSIPMLLSLLIYFRFIMGFFMRHFERQADLYSAVTMGTPMLTISALEKIGIAGGKIRDLPSWHHFSIKKRVDCLLRLRRDPGVVKKHNRFVLLAIIGYFIFIISLVYVVNFSPVKDHFTYAFAEKALKKRLVDDPQNISIYQSLAAIYHENGKYYEAAGSYEKILDMNPNQASALNNLAWLLVTAPEEGLRDNDRALRLAKQAVAIERSPVFLDTLAEAYYVNGSIEEAIRTIKEAIALTTEDRDYYRKQLEKFMASLP